MPAPPDLRASVVDLLTAMGHAKKRRGDTGRARAYLAAANAIARRADFDDVARAGKLRSIPGIGPSIEGTLTRFIASGEKPDWLSGADEESPGTTVFPPVPKGFADAPFLEAPDLHVHTTWSDGTLTIDEVVAYARQLGAASVGLSDHSGSLHIARGLKPAEVLEQWKDIARVQSAHPDVLILRGTECDILRDGTLDHPREILEGFDYVIGSLHSQLKLPLADQTDRVMRALQDPHLTIWGHPTTRVPGYRPRANLDLGKVFAEAARRGVALEVNGNPGRLDLDAPLARQALAAGARLSLGSDAHSAREMLAIRKAREIAAEAGAEAKDLANLEVLRATQKRSFPKRVPSKGTTPKKAPSKARKRA